MPEYSQEYRIIAVNTLLGEDAVLLQRLSGLEGISRLFSFHLDLLSENPSISFTDIVGKGAAIRIRLASGATRYINGFVSRFIQSGRDQRFAHYEAEVVPWLWFLTRNANCRIFQNKTVVEIIKQVFQDHGFAGFFKDKTQDSYETREYVVQYRETDFNFVSRLMEEYGIFYFFEHEPNRHTLVLADSTSAHQNCPNQLSAIFDSTGRVLGEERITSFRIGQEVKTGAYAMNDYNFETPFANLNVHEPTVYNVSSSSTFELYDYPGIYLKKGDGEHLAKTHMQEQEATHLVGQGVSSCGAFTPGYRFGLQDHYRRELNKTYVLTEVWHEANCGGAYWTGQAEEEDTYTNQFTVIPYAVRYRPLRTTPRPFVQGPQTAVVVGPKGEEIYVDKYGRVKVQFFWDREGKADENSSCWIRVSQLWAGKRWGAMWIPRIGQEVIVDFLEGDPDRPIITGRVYNADEMPPYPLPDEMTKSAIKSYSSKGGDGFNEIRFEDKKGSEQVFIHGEKDLDVRIKNDRREWIGRDRHLIVKRDKLEKIERDTQTIVKRDQIELTERDHHLKVQGKEAIEIGGSRSLTVRGDVIEEFRSNHSEQVTCNYYLKGMNVVIEGMTGLTIKVGGSFVNINAAGVQISGPMVLINSGGAPLSGAPGNIVPPLIPPEPAIADDALSGAKSAPVTYGAAHAPATTQLAAISAAPTHDPKSEENKEKKHWIEIELFDEKGKPVPGEPYRITLPDGTTLAEGTLDEKGFARVDHIDPGTCKVTFPARDKQAWKPK